MKKIQRTQLHLTMCLFLFFLLLRHLHFKWVNWSGPIPYNVSIHLFRNLCVCVFNLFLHSNIIFDYKTNTQCYKIIICDHDRILLVPLTATHIVTLLKWSIQLIFTYITITFNLIVIPQNYAFKSIIMVAVVKMWAILVLTTMYPVTYLFFPLMCY